MIKFEFAFEQIYRIKQKLEEQKKLELGEATLQLTREQTKYKDLEDKCEHLSLAFHDETKHTINVFELRTLSASIKFYHEELLAQERRVKKAESNVVKKRQALLEAVAQRQIYEKLKEKAYEQYLEDEKKADNLLMDEIAGYRSVRENRDE